MYIQITNKTTILQKDCLCYWWCGCCTIIQDARQVDGATDTRVRHCILLVLLYYVFNICVYVYVYIYICIYIYIHTYTYTYLCIYAVIVCIHRSYESFDTFCIHVDKSE